MWSSEIWSSEKSRGAKRPNALISFHYRPIDRAETKPRLEPKFRLAVNKGKARSSLNPQSMDELFCRLEGALVKISKLEFNM